MLFTISDNLLASCQSNCVLFCYAEDNFISNFYRLVQLHGKKIKCREAKAMLVIVTLTRDSMDRHSSGQILETSIDSNPAISSPVYFHSCIFQPCVSY